MKTNTRHWAGITVGILSLAGYASAAFPGSEKYTYDASGNIIEKSIDGKVTRMAYDKANRLIGRQTSGQVKQTTTYDAAGRPVTERNADGQPTRSLSYGYGDKVLETQSQDSKAGFYYNAEGQLVGKNVEGTVSTYAWDGNVLAAEGAEAFANEAHISGGIPVLTCNQDIIVSDYLGNTLCHGKQQFTSTAYGEGIETGRFTGKPYVKELGSFVFSYRTYSPETNRWSISDPTGFPNGQNNHTYAGSDPLVNIDPSGCKFFTFDQNQSLWLWNGSGYDGEAGYVNRGTPLAYYPATSNNKLQTVSAGRTPDGWYNINAQIPEGNMIFDTTEPASPPTHKRQGCMTLWIRENANYDGIVMYDQASPANIIGRRCPLEIYLGTLFEVITYGLKIDYINNRLKPPGTENWVFPNNRIGEQATLTIHPEGGAAGTSGSIGIKQGTYAAAFVGVVAVLRTQQQNIIELFVEN